MKYIFCLSLLLAFTLNSYSQEDSSGINTEVDTDEVFKQNEIQLNAFNLVAFGALEVVYERILSENASWAFEGFVHVDKDDYNEAYDKEFSVSGKYKHFFSSKYAKGFYVHGFGMLSSGEYNYSYDYDYETGFETRDSDKYTDFAIGFGLGGKFVSSGGFLLDLSAGIGRNLFNANSPEVTGQFMVNLGYRF